MMITVYVAVTESDGAWAEADDDGFAITREEMLGDAAVEMLLEMTGGPRGLLFQVIDPEENLLRFRLPSRELADELTAIAQDMHHEVYRRYGRRVS